MGLPPNTCTTTPCRLTRTHSGPQGLPRVSLLAPNYLSPYTSSAIVAKGMLPMQCVQSTQKHRVAVSPHSHCRSWRVRQQPPVRILRGREAFTGSQWRPWAMLERSSTKMAPIRWTAQTGMKERVKCLHAHSRAPNHLP